MISGGRNLSTTNIPQQSRVGLRENCVFRFSLLFTCLRNLAMMNFSLVNTVEFSVSKCLHYLLASKLSRLRKMFKDNNENQIFREQENVSRFETDVKTHEVTNDVIHPESSTGGIGNQTRTENCSLDSVLSNKQLQCESKLYNGYVMLPDKLSAMASQRQDGINH